MCRVTHKKWDGKDDLILKKSKRTLSVILNDRPSMQRWQFPIYNRTIENFECWSRTKISLSITASDSCKSEMYACVQCEISSVDVTCALRKYRIFLFRYHKVIIYFLRLEKGNIDIFKYKWFSKKLFYDINCFVDWKKSDILNMSKL